MRYWLVKVSLLIVIFFSFAFFEGSVLNRVLKPYLEHYSFLKKTEKNYIQKEKGLDSFFIEISNSRIHSSLHESEDEVFDCEERGDTNCFISAISCWINENDIFWSKFLLKGSLPINDNEIVINEELSKRKKIKINDIVSIKSPLFYKTVKISGIIINPYGIPTFRREDSFYVLSRITDDYTSKVRGTWYSFSDFKVNDLGLENIKYALNQFNKRMLIICFIFFVIKAVLNFFILFGFQRVFTIRQFYNSLLAAGIKEKLVKVRILLFEMVFIVMSLLLSLVFSKQVIFVLIDFFAAFLVAVINFVFLRRKTYGFN